MTSVSKQIPKYPLKASDSSWKRFGRVPGRCGWSTAEAGGSRAPSKSGMAK